MIKGAAEKCPDSKIFMSGYSEGGMVSHNAVAYLPEELKSRVKVSFYTAYSTHSIASCVVQDQVC